jgi:translation elongation factor aEF-1 beta
LDAVQIAENRVSYTFAKNADSEDLRGDFLMGEVIALIRLMPDGVISDEDMDFISSEVKKIVQKPARLGRVEVKNIAFGLRGLDVTVAVPDVEGGLDPIVKNFGKIKNVENVEVVDVGRI